jgi:hypothetical protein
MYYHCQTNAFRHYYHALYFLFTQKDRDKVKSISKHYQKKLRKQLNIFKASSKFTCDLVCFDCGISSPMCVRVEKSPPSLPLTEHNCQKLFQGTSASEKHSECK